MTEIFEKLIMYFEYPFVRYALIVGVLIALCSSLLGVTLVLKQFSFIGDGLSHVAFGAVAVATIFNLTNELLLVLPITIISAILLLKTKGRSIIKGDASLAMISVSSLAIGYLLVNLFSSSANISGDVCTTLFGSTSILTLSKFDVLLSIGMSIIVIIIYLFLYNKIFAITFDESFATATGVNASLYNLIIAIMTAIIIVLSINLVGSLLIAALIIFPAISSMRVFKSFKAVILCSSLISIICAAVGIIVSILISTPVGSTIILIDILMYFIFYIMGLIRKRG